MGPFKYENLKKPSHPIWKKIADYLLYTGLPAVNAFFIYLEAKTIVSTEFALWGVAISTLLITLFKGGTKFTAKPEV
jgi:hypothetical protein